MRKLRYRLAVHVNGIHSFTIEGNVVNSRMLIQQFQNWYCVMEPELRFQDIEYLPLRCDSCNIDTELSVTRIA